MGYHERGSEAAALSDGGCHKHRSKVSAWLVVIAQNYISCEVKLYYMSQQTLKLHVTNDSMSSSEKKWLSNWRQQTRASKSANEATDLSQYVNSGHKSIAAFSGKITDHTRGVITHRLRSSWNDSTPCLRARANERMSFFQWMVCIKCVVELTRYSAGHQRCNYIIIYVIGKTQAQRITRATYEVSVHSSSMYEEWKTKKIQDKLHKAAY